jgi:protein gp37
MTLSKIEWTDRSDWNPIRGCTRVSPGCGGPGPRGGCYAEAMAARFSKPGQWGHGFAEMRDGKPRWTGRVALMHDRLALPLRWKKPARIFASSTSDLFHEELDTNDIAQVWAYMTAAYWHEFQVLTKRPERARQLLTDPAFRDTVTDFLGMADVEGDDADWPIKNIWLGTSCEDQARADERIPLLLATPAAVRFVSLEPLLGPIDLGRIAAPLIHANEADEGWTFNCLDTGDTYRQFIEDRYYDVEDGPYRDHKLDWVIVGGESGPHARPMHPDWALKIRDDCAAADVPLFFKQWGEWGCDNGPPSAGVDRVMEGRAHCAWWDGSAWRFEQSGYDVDLDKTKTSGEWVYRIGKKAAGRLLDGIEHNAMPVRP